MALEHVLQAYAMFRPDVGYVQGMSYIVGMLLLYMETELEAFQCLANLLGRRSNMDFYRLQKVFNIIISIGINLYSLYLFTISQSV
jgi:hypothetical protein